MELILTLVSQLFLSLYNASKIVQNKVPVTQVLCTLIIWFDAHINT
jgi:hypothetical protein